MNALFTVCMLGVIFGIRIFSSGLCRLLENRKAPFDAKKSNFDIAVDIGLCAFGLCLVVGATLIASHIDL